MTTATDHDTENAVLYAATMEAAEPQPVEPGKMYVVPTGDGGRRLIDLTGDEHKPFPSRKQGGVRVDNVASFAQYFAKHSDGDTEVFADLDHGRITAVLDAHRGGVDGARWECHTLELRMRPTLQWRTWTANNRKYLPQLQFAEFLEDNLLDVAPEPVSAADLLEVATTFQTKTKVSFSSGTVLSSGSIRLQYEETTDASGGAKGQLEVPKVFAVALAPFDDVDRYRIEARLRHRIERSALSLCYILDRPEDVLRDAVLSVVGQVEEACGITVMRSSPGS